ncbi:MULTISPECIES: alpha/beta hydrolase family esterase [unclassified Corynebacterium]|uniref:alpha/beta hydrolase family esterase n=1 Tax=unclassified Corynebacterium TaxID=2624378 RepID=UPI0029CA7A8F|nr:MULTISPECIES: PHB depolymerase family esterase [unclassified Corynebacterium]WPF67073.1 PHB depolymerase family esterase [Corynebacterium sp. 22KM0430]WPF69561.1 PHB depolymerase family esterase [Corynebacterium sp. 21KM1197]
MKLLKTTVAAIAASVSLLAAGSAAAAPASAFDLPAELSSLSQRIFGGDLREITIPVPNGPDRSYLVSVSRNYDPVKPHPVLLAFGGWGDSPEKFRGYSNYASSGVADEAIVIYPRGIENAWAGGPYAKTTAEQDITAVRQMVDQVSTVLNVDRSRVYAAGMSNGGGMAATLACKAPDLVAGVAVVSGAYYLPTNEDCSSAAVPFMDIHGDADSTVPYEGGSRHGAAVAATRDVVASYASRNGCTGETQNGTATSHTGCARPVEEVLVPGGGHEWYSTPNVAEMTWNFLKGQRKA